MEDACKDCGHSEYNHNIDGCGYRYFSLLGSGIEHCKCTKFVPKPAAPAKFLKALLEAIDMYPDLADELMTALREAERHGPGCSCAECDHY